MNISHRQLRSILRIVYSLGAFLGIFVFIYELFFQHSLIYTICYIGYLIVSGGILYLLFARKRPTSRFAYGIFYAMCFVTVLFFVGYVYESATIFSRMKGDLIEYMEGNRPVNPAIHVLIRLSKCCTINEEEQQQQPDPYLEVFRVRYPDTCGRIEQKTAKPCLPFIRNQRNLTIFLCCLMMILRLLTLFLLSKYIHDEYEVNQNEPIHFPHDDDQRSTATSTA